MNRISRKKWKSVILLFILCISITVLCSCSPSNKKSCELEIILNNVDNYADFFKENNAVAEVVEDEDGNYLKVSWENNMEAGYIKTLDKIYTSREWYSGSEKYLVDITVYDINKKENTAQVDIRYGGGWGTRVCYYLPDFAEVKPDWGDYMEAALDVDNVISESELKELYQKAVEMETLMRDEIYRKMPRAFDWDRLFSREN